MSSRAVLRLLVLLALALASAAAAAAQEIRHETRTINIEVPVRVFKGSAFVEDLTIAAFELFEDGRRRSMPSIWSRRAS